MNPKVLMVVGASSMVGVGLLIKLTIGGGFLGEQTRLIYECKKNPQYSAKCAQALAGPAGNPAGGSDGGSSFGISPLSLD
jgi:hypothetical protein